MHIMKSLAARLGILVAAFAFIPAANATLITTGEIDIRSPTTGSGDFSFLIGDVSVSGHHDEGPLLLSGYEGGVFDGSHLLTVGAIEFFYGYIDSQWVTWNTHLGVVNPHATTWTITSPLVTLTQAQTAYRSSFDFHGSLCGSYDYNKPCDVIFPALTGQGIADYLFTESILDDGRHYFRPLRATYTFTEIPEPATLALFCLGLLSIGLSQRRRPIR